MATSRNQSKLYWILSLYFFAVTAFAGDIHPSNYRPLNGGKFYLLSEETFGTNSVASVRLEASPTNSMENEGVDIRLYRIPNPISFLKSQKNLHRPSVEGRYKGEGIRNAVHYVWDVVYKKSRLVWQKILSYTARKKAVTANPSFTQQPAHTYHTTFENNPQFAFISGLEVVQTFRYPLHTAAPIAIKDVKLAGSSSNYLDPKGKEGTIHVPFGKLSPGLYLVEGILGTFRANCLLFVSDTVAVTKISNDELLAWTVHRESGRVSAGASIQVTDGLGSLGLGKSDASGVFVLKKKDMERTYVFGEDAKGGVFVSENFYYDSEIYSHKFYVITDRPIYRPGETVFFRGIGRDFKDSVHSGPFPSGDALLKVIDPSGVTIWKKKLRMTSTGLSGSFPVPNGSVSGGYEINVSFQGKEHTAYVRVASFVKPHFEVDITANEKTEIGKPIDVAINLKYPNGTAVQEADVEVIVRRQYLSMIEGEVAGLDLFPIELSAKEFKSDSEGRVNVTIPALEKPGRLIIQVKATDDHSYRVNKTNEMVIVGQEGYFALSTEKEFSAPNETVVFRLSTSEGKRPVSFDDYTWELIRLEDQTKTTGDVEGKDIPLKISKSGNYVLNVLDKNHLIMATKGHWVEGEGIGTTSGTINIVMDKEIYQPGETANFMVNFAEDVEEAFLTLERDHVEKWSLASKNENWLQLKKTGPKSLQGSIRIEELFAPNMTFSVVYVRKGKFVFENKGIKVEIPKIDISYKFDKTRYAPGETVTLDIQTTLKGRKVASEMAIGVVDEMIYALQPEVAPSIFDFFYHLRRNQVKTSASLAFHSFDAAVSAVNLDTPDSSYAQRNVKVIKDRARREDKDTAYWNGDLKTDSDGHARVTFRMPDSITKWRVTARAFAGNFNVGQKTGAVDSYKDFYHTYVGPKEFRKGDKPNITYIVFNYTGKEQKVKLELEGVGSKFVSVGSQPVYVNFQPTFNENKELLSKIETQKVPDLLATKVKIDEEAWLGDFILSAGEKFPSDAKEITAYPFSDKSEKVMSAIDSLWDYPYGCVEQTSSRLLPLSLGLIALQKSSANEEFLTSMQRRIYESRSRLVRMAGHNAAFTWWGDMTEGNFLLKVYAFFTDYNAARALDITLPAAHWESLLEDYRSESDKLSFSDRVLVIWMMREMGLPVKTLLSGAVEKMPPAPTESYMLAHSSLYLDHDEDASTWSVGTLLLDTMGAQLKDVEKARANLKDTPYLLGRAVLALNDSSFREANLDNILTDAAHNTEPTFDRSMSLALLWKSLNISSETKGPALAAPWVKKVNGLDRPFWILPDPSLAGELDTKNFLYTYKSAQDQKSVIPVKIVRKFYELNLVSKANEEDLVFEDTYQLGSEVAPDSLLSSGLYIDKITVSTDKNYAYSILEVPLSSGMELETQTWGIHFKDGDKDQILGKAKVGPYENYYVIPVDSLSGQHVYYNLIRPEISGTFMLPPVRFHRMYAPKQMAFEGESKLDFKKLTVR